MGSRTSRGIEGKEKKARWRRRGKTGVKEKSALRIFEKKEKDYFLKKKDRKLLTRRKKSFH